MNKTTIVIFIILLIGIIFRLITTSDGNFLFNMDNARDMVDVREMVVLHKLRLTGPTSAIEGFYNGPAWYYLLAIPFIISGGNPFASIVMEIVLWAVGGFFLLKLVSRWGSWLVLPIGLIWVASDYVVLATRYAFNPNPVILLTPLFLYLLVEYLKKGQTIYALLTWFLAGMFFNFEMNFGIFTPIIIVISIIFTKRIKFLRQKAFWFGVVLFIATLLPQIIFDLKHQFIMSKAILHQLSGNAGTNVDFIKNFQNVSLIFYNTFSATLMNHKLFALIIFIFCIPIFWSFLKKKEKDDLVLVSIILIIVPFLGYLFLPVNVNSWHLGGEMAASLILIAYILRKRIFIPFTVLIIWFGLLNIFNFFTVEFGKPNLDPSLYKNEVAAIAYVYNYANGQNFKVYTYLPSVYDYPYQYLIWWYGQKKYGYLPVEYVYSPNKPLYIPSQDKFQSKNKNSSDLVFLIKEPDRINMRVAWENDYKSMVFVSKEMLGGIEVEIRRE